MMVEKLPDLIRAVYLLKIIFAKDGFLVPFHMI